MPSKYLFLSEANSNNITSGRKWVNLPVLSEATRECYVSVLDCIVTAVAPGGEDPALNENPIFLRLNIPSMNYFSSDNKPPIMNNLIFIGGFSFAPNLKSSVEILTNDNLKSIEVTLTDEDGGVVPFTIDHLNLTLKIDYIDQKAIAQDYLSQIPMRL